ncbi:MAG: hypothetical protein Q9173_002960 [Seirophora scorigena]
MTYVEFEKLAPLPAGHGISTPSFVAQAPCQGLEEDEGREVLEPIAVIGLSLTFPQTASSPEAFWQMLVDGKSALTEIPKDRFNWKSFFDENGKAHFVAEDIAAFDAQFFSITPNEAACMDPQQRWLLETAYRAFENAGVSLEQAAGSKTSVHIGSFNNDYSLLLQKDLTTPKRYFATGTEAGMLANRLSWFFDLKGPSMQVDTACSSSLNALHLACQNMRCGEADMGLVGGCNLFFNPESMCAMSDMTFLSPDGISYAFDHRANGYSRGEGLGLVVIKLLSRAIEDGDTIRAVIRATGANQDGRTPGITQPNAEAQMALIRDTYRSAGLDPRVPAPRLVTLLKLERSMSVSEGSEGASGIAGLIKTVLVLESGSIPQNIWLERVNPQIPLDEWNIQFPAQSMPWPSHGLRRASINSFGFGGSNTHAVVDDARHYLQNHGLSGIHTTAPDPTDSTSNQMSPENQALEVRTTVGSKESDFVEGFPPVLLVLSSSDRDGLTRWVTSYQTYLSKDCSSIKDHTFLNNLAFTLGSKRSHLAWRSYAIASSVAVLKNDIADLLSTPVRSKPAFTVGFVFTGQGAQWSSMGQGLLLYPIFNQAMIDADQQLQEWGELARDSKTSRLGEPAFSQPICTALQIAIVKLLRSWNIVPAAVIGHSSGEIAAAFCSGAISDVHALRIAYLRGLSISRRECNGEKEEAMMAVGLSDANVQEYLKPSTTEGGQSFISIGCINSPRNVTLSGTRPQLVALQQNLISDGVFARLLPVNCAYHSESMAMVGTDYLQLLRSCPSSPAASMTSTMISSISGGTVSTQELRSEDYWVRNLISPVRFADAIQKLFESNPRTKAHTKESSITPPDFLVEVGPSATLRTSIRENLAGIGRTNDIGYGSILVKGSPAVDTAMHLAGSLHSRGCPVDLLHINCLGLESQPRLLTDLPGYPFDHSQKYWIESRLSKNFRFRQHDEHELLGTAVIDWNPLDARWRKILKPSENEWMADHKVNGSVLLPAAAFIAMAIEAAKRLVHPDQEILAYRIQNATFTTAIVLSPDQDGTEVEMRLGQDYGYVEESRHSLRRTFQLFVLAGQEWSECSHGTVILDYQTRSQQLGAEIPVHEKENDNSFIARCSTSLQNHNLYPWLRSAGMQYGPTFQTLTSVAVHGRGGEATGIVRPKVRGASILHPTMLDGIFQLMFPALQSKGELHPSAMLPTRVDNLWISANGAANTNEKLAIQAHAHGLLQGFRHAEFSMEGRQLDSGATIISTTGFRAVFMTDTLRGYDQHRSKKLCYNVDWRPAITHLDNPAISALCRIPTATIQDRPSRDLLRLAAGVYITKALRDERRHEAPLKPHLQKYTAWMHQALAELHIDNPMYLGLRWVDILTHPELQDQILSKLEEGAYSICHIYSKIGSRLPDLLTGRLDALEYLFDDDLMTNFYAAHLRDQLTSKMSAYMDLSVHQNPNLRIIEVGAGTGGMTKAILKHILQHGDSEMGTPRFANYTYTDISANFVESFQNIFKGNEHRAAFEKLDVEKDPATQEKFRSRTPLVTLERWDLLLKSTGFSGVDIHWPDHEDEHLRDLSILVSTASELQNRLPQVPQRISIIIGENRGFQQAVAKELQVRYLEQGMQGCGILNFQEIDEESLLEDGHCIMLVELGRSILYNITEADLSCIKTIVQRSESLVWVTGGGDFQASADPKMSLATGLCRTLRSEMAGKRFANLALEEGCSVQRVVHHTLGVYTATTTAELEQQEAEYQEVNGVLQISRVVEASYLDQHVLAKIVPQKATMQPLQGFEGRELGLMMESVGALDSLVFVEDVSVKELPGPHEVDVKVRASGLLFRDVLIASGLYDDTSFGLEFAGTVIDAGSDTGLTAGQQICGWAHGCTKTRVRCTVSAVQSIPQGMTFAEAASIPVAYCTAYHCLVTVARMKPGETILIHSGAGGTGQAAIQLAKHLNARIFATVGNEEKKAFLSRAHGIPESNILSSRSPSFKDEILAMTQGHGVDIVLNSLRDEALHASLECLAPFGRFVDLGRKNYATLPMSLLSRSITFATVDLSHTLGSDPGQLGDALKAVMDLFAKRVFTLSQPLSVFGVSRVTEAFRHMQSGKSMGKIVIELGQEDHVKVASRTIPASLFHPNASYLVAGGLGGIGRSVARWMANRGAKNLILLSRSALHREDAQQLITELQRKGVRVETPACDIADEEALALVLASCSQKLPPIKGCIQSTLALNDKSFQDMTQQSFLTAIRPKVHGSWNLHKLLPNDLDFFILFSSIQGIVGSKFQANYACGNVYQDALARHRVRNGQKAFSLDIGIMRSVGVVAEHEEVSRWLELQGYMGLEEEELHAILEYHCDPRLPVLSERKCQVVTGLHTPMALEAKGLAESPWLRRPFFNHLRQIGIDEMLLQGGTGRSHEDNGDGKPQAGSTVDFITGLQAAKTTEEACDLVCDALATKLSASLGVPREDIDVSKPAFAYGADSLSAIGISHWLEREMACQVSVFEILDRMSVMELSRVAARKSGLLKGLYDG